MTDNRLTNQPLSIFSDKTQVLIRKQQKELLEQKKKGQMVRKSLNVLLPKYEHAILKGIYTNYFLVGLFSSSQLNFFLLKDTKKCNKIVT